MNSLFIFLGIESWKPVLTALMLPPVPLLVLLLIGVRLILPRRGLGWLVVLTSVTLLWLSTCAGMAQVLTQYTLRPPPALSADRIKELKAQAKNPIAIIVLGGGKEAYAPEYGVSNLSQWSLERLRYGLWLSRETGLSAGFSGGIGWAQSDDGAPEARIAAQVAATEFARPLKWVEETSRDTRENAARSVALLSRTGVTHIVLVTHGWHMPRAVAAFEQAAAGRLRIEPAPMGLAQHVELPALRWVPTAEGMVDMRNVMRELAGRLFGAW